MVRLSNARIGAISSIRLWWCRRELEAGGEALSGQINEAVRAEIERRRRRRLLSEFLDALDAERGPVDEQLVSKYTRLLA